MRTFLTLLLALLFIQLQAYTAQKKLYYAAGYRDVQIVSIDHRGIQIMHRDGICFLQPNDLSETDKRNLAEELKTYELRKKQYAAQQAALAKQRRADAQKAKAARAAQGKEQVKEVNEMIKKYKNMKLYKIIVDLEKKFDIENNRNMGLRGRVQALSSRINMYYPLASNRRALINILVQKRNEVEKKLRAEASKRKAEEARRKAEKEKKK